MERTGGDAWNDDEDAELQLVSPLVDAREAGSVTTEASGAAASAARAGVLERFPWAEALVVDKGKGKEEEEEKEEKEGPPPAVLAGTNADAKGAQGCSFEESKVASVDDAPEEEVDIEIVFGGPGQEESPGADAESGEIDGRVAALEGGAGEEGEAGEEGGLVAAAQRWVGGTVKSEFVASVVASARDRRSERLDMACSGLDHGMARFRVNDLLGEGKFGEVFDVEHKVLGGRYALKTLKAVRSVKAISRYCCHECVTCFVF